MVIALHRSQISQSARKQEALGLMGRTRNSSRSVLEERATPGDQQVVLDIKRKMNGSDQKSLWQPKVNLRSFGTVCVSAVYKGDFLCKFESIFSINFNCIFKSPK